MQVMQLEKGGQVEQIKGGYYIKARKIQESEVSRMPPCTREIWDYLLMKANHKDSAVCKRGQHLTSVNQIREALSWYAGWRKNSYKISDCENSMKRLRAAGMITTKKTARGMLVTIVNYDTYQDPSRYENRTTAEQTDARLPENCRMINKNEKNDKNKKNEEEVVQLQITEQDVTNAWDALGNKVTSQFMLSRSQQHKLIELNNLITREQFFQGIERLKFDPWFNQQSNKSLDMILSEEVITRTFQKSTPQELRGELVDEN